ncbi:putative lipoprotein [Ruegeria lacuscaerulensis ITI-1157]|nr:putative lipoprotein [Ruegeria lacuscaerulensis ITI-1157]SHJ85933.1 hypothetical protein SAMN05444404_2786 [Ruegeria lacuscaerulensis ITI-1157]
MFVIRNYVTTGGTVACALAIGYLMQKGPAAAPAAADAQQASLEPVGEATVLAGLEEIVLTSANPPEDAISIPQRPQRAKPGVAVDCSLRAHAAATANASARLVLKAPCNPNEVVELHHSGMTFSATTDAQGQLDVTIPALSEYAIFLISFDDHRGTVATTHIPDVSDYDRVALQWSGNTELQLHALEFGASYGQAGHVWSQSLETGTGRVDHLGDSGARNVEVYSIPKTGDRGGSVALTVEAEVTPDNCGRDLNLQSLELLGDQTLRARDLQVTLPACDSGQDFLVLNNLFQDLKIASK